MDVILATTALGMFLEFGILPRNQYPNLTDAQFEAMNSTLRDGFERINEHARNKNFGAVAVHLSLAYTTLTGDKLEGRQGELWAEQEHPIQKCLTEAGRRQFLRQAVMEKL